MRWCGLPLKIWGGGGGGGGVFFFFFFFFFFPFFFRICFSVFSNLISNNIKYRPSVGVPQVNISATEGNGEWIFCVADNGIGLDMKNASKIFGMFQRLHQDGEYEANGIGLALCKIVIEKA